MKAGLSFSKVNKAACSNLPSLWVQVCSCSYMALWSQLSVHLLKTRTKDRAESCLQYRELSFKVWSSSSNLEKNTLIEIRS